MPGKYGLVLIFFGVLTAAIAVRAQRSPSENARSADTSSTQALPERVRVSAGVTRGLLIKKVNPKYPKTARKQHLEGTVILTATISKEGEIADLTLVSGEPMLAEAAITAVKQWKYRPYLLEGRPVAVETQIQVNFELRQ